MNSIVIRYKINVQKSVVYLYMSNETAQMEIKKILFTVASKTIKYLEINLSKEVKSQYSGNYKTVIK